MSKRIRELQARKSALVKDARQLTDAATAAGRDLTAEESSKFDGLRAQIDSTNAAIEREQLLALEEAQIGVEVPGTTEVRVEERREADPKRGFKSFAEFAQAVKTSSIPGQRTDGRLAAAPTTYGNESAGADGGYAVPPDFSREIMTIALGEDSLVPLTENVEIGGNSMVFPKDETTPWGTDGVRAYWQQEASAATQTKPKLSNATLRLHKLMALVPLTDELLADTNALDSWLPGKVADSIRWKANEAILWGTGVGQPQGVFNSGAVVSVAKESAQAAASVVIANVAKMIARLPQGSYGRAVWMINNDVLPQIFTMTNGNYPAWLPINSGAQGNPYGTLLGRPVIVTQHAKTVGTVGDVVLADMSYYRTITKAGGIQTATSMHLYFDADAMAFRATFRIDGQSKILSAITPANGSNNLSPYVTLATRA